MTYSFDDYSSFTDEELISRLRSGEEHIMEYLLEKYKKLVLSKAKSMFILGGDTQDLVQEGMIGLFKAIRDFDEKKDASFMTFADLCISRNIYTAVSHSGRKKFSPLNSYISIYEENAGLDESGKTLLDVLSDAGISNPEEIVIKKEEFENLMNTLSEVLSPFEKQVFDLHVTGMNYAEIAKVLDTDSKSTDNALTRIKGKVRKVIDSVAQ